MKAGFFCNYLPNWLDAGWKGPALEYTAPESLQPGVDHKVRPQVVLVIPQTWPENGTKCKVDMRGSLCCADQVGLFWPNADLDTVGTDPVFTG